MPDGDKIPPLPKGYEAITNTPPLPKGYVDLKKKVGSSGNGTNGIGGFSTQQNDIQKPVGQISNEQVNAANQQLQSAKNSSTEQNIVHAQGEQQHKAQDKKVYDAAVNTVNKKNNFGRWNNKPSQIDELLKGVDSGNLAVTKDAAGNDVIKPTGNFIQSYNTAYANEFYNRMNNIYLSSLPKDKAIEYLNQKAQHPEAFSQEQDIAPSGISKLLGEQTDMLAKGTIGGIGGRAFDIMTGGTGGGTTGTFTAMAKDLAAQGYGNALEKNYQLLKKHHPELGESEIYDRAHQAALLGETLNLGTGALLSAELKPALNTTTGVIKMFKTAPKVVGSAAAQSFANDIETNSISGGQGVTWDDMVKNAENNATPMAVMHFGLQILPSVMSGNKSIVPSPMRPQIENMVASADRGKVEEYYRKGEASGVFPEGTTDKILNKLHEFEQHKEIVKNLPISEDRKAAIAGKLIQRDNLKEKADLLSKYGASFNSQIEDINKQKEKIEAETNELVKGEPIEKIETDNITGETILPIKPFDKLNKEQISGIEVPKDYGETNVEQIGEGEDKKFISKAFVIETKGGLKPRTEIEVTDKKFSDKNDAQAAADKALAKHYYENELPNSLKPKYEKVKNKEVSLGENNETGDSENGRIAPDEGSTNKEDAGETLQPQQTEENGITVIKPEENISNDNVTEVNSTENPKTNSVVEDKPEDISENKVDESNEEGEGGNTSGGHHVALNKLADKLGLPPIEKGDVLSPEEYTKRGQQLLREGANPKEVADDFEKTGKVNAESISVAKAHLANLDKAAENARIKFGEKSNEFADAKKEADDWARYVMKPMGTKFGEVGRALQGETDLDTGNFVSVQRSFEERNGKPMTAQQKVEGEKLSNEVRKLNEQVDNLKEQLSTALDKADALEKGNKKFSEKAKNVADRFRKLKTKPFTFKDENGNDIPIQIQGVTWNDLVELGAKAIEKTGKIADGISAIVDKIKDTDFYANLSANDKQKLQEQLQAHYEGASSKQKAKANNVADLAERFADKKDNKFSIEDVKDIWDYAKETYLNHDDNFSDLVNGVATDLGLTPEQVRHALASPKGTRTLTNEMYQRQYERRKATQKAEYFVNHANESNLSKGVKLLPRIFFNLKTFGHGTVGFITHAGTSLFNPASWKVYFPAFLKQFQFAYGKLADYEKAMDDLKRDKLYVTAKRAGLAVDPDKVYDDYQNNIPLMKKISGIGDRGFNALKVLRLELFKQEYGKLSQLEKADPQTAKNIATILNHGTGASNIPLPEASSIAFFAPRLEASRWARLIAQPAKAVNTFANWSKSSAADKVAAKIVARRAGNIIATYAAGLAANQALLSLTGSKQSINFTKPNESDFLKFKIAGRTLDFSGGMISAIDFLSQLAHIATEPKDNLKKNNRGDLLTSSTARYITGKFSPFLGTGKDFLTHHDFEGNTMPFSNDKPFKGKHQLTWGEYFKMQQTPIPVAETFKDIHKQLQDNGMSESEVNRIMQGILVGTLSGGTGVRIGEEPVTTNLSSSTGRTSKTQVRQTPKKQVIQHR